MTESRLYAAVRVTAFALLVACAILAPIAAIQGAWAAALAFAISGVATGINLRLIRRRPEGDR